MFKPQRPTDLPIEQQPLPFGAQPVRSYGYGEGYKPASDEMYFEHAPVLGRTFSVFADVIGIHVLGTERRRRMLEIQNQGAGNVWVGLGTVPQYDPVSGTAVGGYLVPSNSMLSFTQHCPVNDIYVVSDTPGTALLIAEGVFDGYLARRRAGGDGK